VNNGALADHRLDALKLSGFVVQQQAGGQRCIGAQGAIIVLFGRDR